MLLKTYTGEPLKLQGEAQVTVCYKDQKVELPLIVAKGDGPPIARSKLATEHCP